FFDPGFKGGGAAYTDYLDMLHRQDVNYRVVRSMESVSFGAAKLYVMRPSSFGVDGVDGKALSLCVVHGDNSFLLSGGLHGEAATFRNSPGLSATQIPRMLFEGASAPLKAVGSFFGRGGAIVLESNGREIGVRSLRQITVSPSHDPDSSAALGTLLTTSTKASVPAGARKAKININTASVSELDKLDGIGPKKAATVVEFRKKHGPFRTIEDIQKVPGIGEKLFERNRDRMCVR
ncbi:MAG: ComEA family DNA-binding protein, partial [bacterium]